MRRNLQTRDCDSKSTNDFPMRRIPILKIQVFFQKDMRNDYSVRRNPQTRDCHSKSTRFSHDMHSNIILCAEGFCVPCCNSSWGQTEKSSCADIRKDAEGSAVLHASPCVPSACSVLVQMLCVPCCCCAACCSTFLKQNAVRGQSYRSDAKRCQGAVLTIRCQTHAGSPKRSNAKRKHA